MKGIYLTEQAKQEIEAIIETLEKSNAWDETENSMIFAKCELYKDILSSATILPVEESWTKVGKDTGTMYNDDADVLLNVYPNGVVIQPKK